MERHASERRRTPCAEFPNDNQDLHHGATWMCLELGGEPACERPRACVVPEIASLGADPMPTDDFQALAPLPFLDVEARTVTAELDPDPVGDQEEPIEIVDELCFDDALFDDALEDLPSEPDAGEPARESAPADAFAQFVAALADVVLSLGAGDEGVACLEALFGRARFEGMVPGERAAEALVTGGVIAPCARGFTRSSAFTTKVLAWQGILLGESEDFSLPDGGALEPLDEWAADLVARIVGPPSRVDGIRRDLRRRGIAAFGLVAEAA
jgi:hypothetical protein